jgi:hypothetical protein
MKTFFNLYFFLTLPFSFFLNAEDMEKIKVEAFVSPAFIHIGDNIHYHIRARFDPSLKVEFPLFGENLSGFAIREFSPRKEWEEQGQKVIEETYALHTFIAGDYVIPSAMIRYGAKNVDKTVETGAVYVRVDSRLKGRDIDIRDIAPPISFSKPFRWKIWALWIGIPLSVLALIACFVRWWVGRVERVMEDKRSAWEIALDDVENLKSKHLLEAHQFREHYYALSDILRNYIERRFGLMAPERTTEEFIKLIRTQSVFSEEHQRLLVHFLQECDLVKFAKATPEFTQTDLGSGVERVLRFLRETIPVTATQTVEETQGNKKL